MRVRGWWAWASIVVAGWCVGEARGEAKMPEYDVKAAFVYKFVTYIRWPATGVDAKTTFVIGVLGKDPFGKALDTVVRGQRVQGRTIVVNRLADVEEALHCDVLFVSSSEREHLQRIITILHGVPILTIADMERFAESGGMINLITTEDNRIHFDINKRALDRAGLKAPAQLLDLARIVESRTDGEKR